MKKSTKASWVAPAEAGEALGVSLSTIWRMIQSGQLPTTQIGRRRFVSTRALTRRLNPKVIKAQPAPLPAGHGLLKLIGAG